MTMAFVKFRMHKIWLLVVGVLLCVFVLHAVEASHAHFALSRMNDSSRHFLAYLPHSGISNQINELSNALMMAHFLNRTLILPPFFLGLNATFPWSSFNRLNSTIFRIIREFHSNLNDSSWTLLNPSEIFPGLSSFSGIRTIPYFSMDKQLLQLRAFRAYVLKDYGRYNYRYRDEIFTIYRYVVSECDNNQSLISFTNSNGIGIRLRNNTNPSLKYSATISFGYKSNSSMVAQNILSILHVGSLFGQMRVQLASQDEQDVQEFASYKRHISRIISNPMVPCFDILASHARVMLRNGTYFSVHLRSKFPFSRYVKSVAKSSLKLFLEDARLYAALEACLKIRFSEKDSCTIFIHGLKNKTLLLDEVPLFVATDIDQFSTSAEHAILSKGFKKIITLDDLMSSNYTKPLLLKCLRDQNPVNPIPIELLYPLFDQLLAAHALVFIGTRGSTFSHLIHKIHLAQLEPQIDHS